MRAAIILTIVIALARPLASSAQTAPALAFTSPTATSYATGLVVLRVAIRGLADGDAVQDVTFFADGQQVCVAPGAGMECSWEAGAQLTAHAFRAVARLRGGGRAVANIRTLAPDYVDSVSVDVILANAVVTDGGRFVTGLPREAFRLFDDGQERPITSFHSTDAPLDIVLALDVSESMRPVLEDVKAGALAFIRALRPQDRVTLVVFNDRIAVPVRSVSSPETVAKAIAELTAFGATALFDAVVRSLDLLSQQTGKHALVLFSDGLDRISQSTIADVQRKVGVNDAMVFAIGLGAKEAEMRDRLALITGASGGRVLVADRSQDLKGAFAEIVRDVINQYTLGFEPRRDGRRHTIKVELVGHSGRVRARQAYTLPVSSSR